MLLITMCVFFFFKQKTAYEVRISDWSSDVCSSDLTGCQERASIVTALVHIPRTDVAFPRDVRGIPTQGASPAIAPMSPAPHLLNFAARALGRTQIGRAHV